MPTEKQKSAPACWCSKSHSPPEKQLAGAARRQRKKPPQRAAISVLFPKWCNFTLLREPSFSGAVSKPRRLSAHGGQAARLTHSSAETGFAQKCKIAPQIV
jgi:hypothetical protein